MNAWELPTSLIVNGHCYAIRTDFRVILDILKAMNDPDLFESGADEQEKAVVRIRVMLAILYEDYENMPTSDWQEAAKQACNFIDCGIEQDDSTKRRPRTMDWEQDAPLMIPAINKVVGQDVRSIPYMHWWTFFGAYMEIGRSLFSQVLDIRQKKSRGKKLEKWEREFYDQNRALIDIKRKYSEEELKEREEWEEFFKEWGG